MGNILPDGFDRVVFRFVDLPRNGFYPAVFLVLGDGSLVRNRFHPLTRLVVQDFLRVRDVFVRGCS